MEGPSPSTSPGGRSLASLAFLVLGVVVFALFHFIPEHGRPGWVIWPLLVDAMRQGYITSSVESSIGVASFVTLSLLVTTAPFASRAMARSAIVKGLYATFCILTALVMLYFVMEERDTELGLLALSAMCSSIGIALVPSRKPESVPPGTSGP